MADSRDPETASGEEEDRYDHKLPESNIDPRRSTVGFVLFMERNGIVELTDKDPALQSLVMNTSRGRLSRDPPIEFPRDSKECE